RVSGHMLSSTAGLNHFLNSARSVQADVIVIDPLYSTHDQDENDTRAMAALCQALVRLRDASKAALIIVHHTRKAAGRHELGTADLAIRRARDEGFIVHDGHQYRLPLQFSTLPEGRAPAKPACGGRRPEG